MNIPDQELLHRLGAGESIQSVCTAAGISHQEFDAWWKAQTAARVPPMTGTHRAKVARPVRIDRSRGG